MKKTFGIILLLVLGWLVGYLRIPYLENSNSFFQGFIICLAMVAVFSLLYGMSKSSRRSSSRSYRKKFGLLYFLLVLLAGLYGYKLLMDQEALRLKLGELTSKLELQQTIIDQAKYSSQKLQVSKVLDQLEKELDNSQDRVVSDSMITVLSELSESFKPYWYTPDTLEASYLSPERGYLLLALMDLTIDSTSFAQLIKQVSFAHADLSSIVIQGVQLNGIDLSGSDFSQSELLQVEFNGSKLKGSNFKASKLIDVKIQHANMAKVDMRWSSVTSGDFSHSEISGSDLSHADLIGLAAKKSRMTWVKLDGAQLMNANFSGADLFSSSLKKANLGNANMEFSRLSKANLQEAILEGTQFHKTVVREDWLEQLNEWNIREQAEIIKTYRLVEGSTDISKMETHQLQKIN